MLTSRIMSLRGVQRRSNPQHSGGDCFATLAMTWRKKGQVAGATFSGFQRSGMCVSSSLPCGRATLPRSETRCDWDLHRTGIVGMKCFPVLLRIG